MISVGPQTLASEEDDPSCPLDEPSPEVEPSPGPLNEVVPQPTKSKERKKRMITRYLRSPG
jgi:hypothetical protein